MAPKKIKSNNKIRKINRNYFTLSKKQTKAL